MCIRDSYTTMDFVVDILVTVFHKSESEAEKIMLNVHKKGVGICGVYPYELAETKVETVTALAKNNGFPLKSSMEKAQYMISKELSATLGFAVREAKKRRHEYVCVEHVLFAILHDAYGVEILSLIHI
eukprot:TRINITY_DN10712_c0_g2_i1.p1 TRINITY_DN10712_c0_g2~~TRINITY_DN10712_c0_g2_i1.p1  ORF type:complete len:128 (+),score=14.46 TRINITY_DN10712_c0_g2_i1:42-425(+)